MSDQFCACGNSDGTNDECERCRLIAQLTAAQQRVKELEAEASNLGRDSLHEVYNEIITKRMAMQVPMAVGKHTAANAKYCKETVEALQATGHHSAADWAIWMLWWRMMDWQRAEQVDETRLEDIDRLTAENAKLRELLREAIEWLDYVGLVDRIKAALEE